MVRVNKSHVQAVEGGSGSENTSIREFFIQWHLTERCNLQCSHCYQNGTPGNELSFSESSDFITEVSDMLKEWSDSYDIDFAPSFNVTGGEPFLRNDFISILKDINKKGIDIYVLSNGTLINREKAGSLAGLGVKGVQVSIEGPRDVHDKIRGQGTFDLSLRGIENLLRSKLEVTLNVTLSNLNAGHIDEMISLASCIGVQRLGFSRLVPSGRGRQLLGEMIEPATLKNIYKTLLTVKVNGLEIVTGDPVAAQMGMRLDSDTGCTAYGGCAAGISGLTVRPDGTINPCRRLNIDIGNVKRDSVRKVWTSSEVLSQLRDKGKYKGKCGSCGRWANCRGCRAVAYACSQSGGENDFLAEDPQCFVGEEICSDPD